MSIDIDKYKVLLVDDDQMNGQLLHKRLTKRGFDCDYVSSGKECLEALSTQEYSIVLLDILMPDISGIEVLNEIRKEKSNLELPVIMVTAKDEAQDVVDALKKDANDYLTKPVNIDIAVARINTQLKILDLVQESLSSKQLSTINTLVTTMNHEINNPLAIAVGNLSILKEKVDEQYVDIERIKKAMDALKRITEIVKKIEQIGKGDMEETAYSKEVNMFKIHK
jgi:DNA-binding response OmpR family regulator